MIPDSNAKGEYMLWDDGKPIGYVPVDYVDGVMVVAKMKSVLMQMKQAAKLEGIDLTLAAGLRTFGKQLELRKRNAKDQVKAHDETFLLTASSSEFNPVTARPGYSNHHDGQAHDFNVTGKPEVYKWLVKNAAKLGFIRTVPSERWHWEYRPGKSMFSVVPFNHPTWDGLIIPEQKLP